jgi:hypothetical protein
LYQELTPELRSRLEAIRFELRGLDFRRLTDEELVQVIEDDLGARASNAIEGLYADPAQDAFFRMLNEERVPLELRVPYIVWFVLGEKRAPIR